MSKNTQNLVITADQAILILKYSIACFECDAQLCKPIRDFVSQNYSLNDFRENGVNPFDFDDWLNCSKKDWQ